MIKIKQIALVSMALASAMTANAQSKNQSNALDVSATVIPGCILNGSSVNFGRLQMPLVTQTASSQIEIICSKGAQFTIDLAYGGIYGQGDSSAGSQYTGLTIRYDTSSSTENKYMIFNSSGSRVGELNCAFDGTSNASLNSSYSHLKLPTCQAGNNQSSAKPIGWVGGYAAIGEQPLRGGFSHGMLRGSSAGEEIMYSVEIPGDPSKVWSKGVNAYSSTATGIQQSIPVKVNIVVSGSPIHFMAQDNFLDTMTATVIY